jgi:hypothetical protein
MSSGIGNHPGDTPSGVELAEEPAELMGQPRARKIIIEEDSKPCSRRERLALGTHPVPPDDPQARSADHLPLFVGRRVLAGDLLLYPEANPEYASQEAEQGTWRHAARVSVNMSIRVPSIIHERRDICDDRFA